MKEGRGKDSENMWMEKTRNRTKLSEIVLKDEKGGKNAGIIRGKQGKNRSLFSEMFVLTIKVDSDIIRLAYFLRDDRGAVGSREERRALFRKPGAFVF